MLSLGSFFFQLLFWKTFSKIVVLIMVLVVSRNSLRFRPIFSGSGERGEEGGRNLQFRANRGRSGQKSIMEVIMSY